MIDRTQIVIRSFAQAGLTLGVAESLTGGALCAELIRPAGASAVVRGGIVAYATSLKSQLLGVDRGLLEVEGPVHPQVAAAMAAGVRRAVAVDGSAADVGIATTGVAGPDAQGGRPPGTVFIAVDSDAGSAVRQLSLVGDRGTIRRGTVDAAIALLAEIILHAGSERE